MHEVLCLVCGFVHDLGRGDEETEGKENNSICVDFLRTLLVVTVCLIYQEYCVEYLLCV